MSDELPSDEAALQARLNRARLLLYRLRATASPEQATQLDELGSTLDAFAKARRRDDTPSARRTEEWMIILGAEARTPLTAIMGFADILSMRPDLSPEKRTEFARIIATKARHVGNLFQDIIYADSIEASRVWLSSEPVRVCVVFEQAQEWCKSLVQAHEHTLTISCSEDISTVWADSRHLVHVLSELLTNACKYTPNGGSITLSAEAISDCVRIAVRDTGIGMAQEQLLLLGGRTFWRADHPLVREQTGTGLGFYIAKNLVRLMGGEIEVESAPDVGTTVSFTLPIALPQAGEVE